MKSRMQRFISVFVLAIYFCAPVGAQKKKPQKRSAAESAAAEAQRLRTRQLLILHEDLLSRTLDRIKKMDEVTLRLSVRIQLLSYFWEGRTLSGKYVSLKRNLALEAIADLNDHHREMPRFMVDYLLADLAALIERHQPDLTEKLKAVNETAKIDESLQYITPHTELQPQKATRSQPPCNDSTIWRTLSGS